MLLFHWFTEGGGVCALKLTERGCHLYLAG